MFEELFAGIKFDSAGLKAYGFKTCGDAFVLKKQIMDGLFSLKVTIRDEGVPDTSLIESDTGDEYVLYKTAASGKFVGMVRQAVRAELLKIAENCGTSAVFKQALTLRIIDEVKEKYGASLEFLWSDLPAYAVFRRSDTKKWFGVVMAVPKVKLGLKEAGLAELLNVHLAPDKVAALIDDKNFFKAWHMNKQHWLSILLTDALPISKAAELIEESFLLAGKAGKGK